MEISQNFQSCPTTIETIREIQNNLWLLKSKIAYLTKQDYRASENVFKALSCTATVINKKISHSPSFKFSVDFLNKLGLDCSQKSQQSSAKNRSASIINKRQSRSNLIRQLSRHNQQKVRKQMEQSYAQKKKHHEKIKKSEDQSRRKIQEFHLLKQIKKILRKFKIRKQKRNEEELLRAKVIKGMDQLKVVEQEKDKLERKIESSSSTAKSIDEILKYIENMDHQELQQILKTLGIKSVSNLGENEIKKILISAELRRKAQDRNIDEAQRRKQLLKYS